MNFLFSKYHIKSVFLYILVLCVLIFNPPSAISAGYQEARLLNADIYTIEEQAMMVDQFTTKIQVLDRQINTLEHEINWLILKVNRLEDSGHMAPSELKQSVSDKQEKIRIIQKEKNRLTILVNYYTPIVEKHRQEMLEKIIEKKIQVDERKSKPKAGVKKTTLQSGLASQMMVSQMAPQAASDTGLDIKKLQDDLKRTGLENWVEFAGTQDDCMKIKTALPILFPTGKAAIPDQYKDFLTKLGSFLKPYNVKIYVDGYADKIPISNKAYPSNFELGAMRAANIVHALVSQGIKPSVFKISSSGKYRDSAGGMMNNNALERRVEITILLRA